MKFNFGPVRWIPAGLPWRGVMAVLAIVCLAVFAALAGADHIVRDIEQARRSDHVAAAAATFVRDTFDQYQSLLAQLAESAAAAGTDDAGQHQLLELAPALGPSVAGAAIVRNGVVVARSGPGVPDAVFAAAASDAALGWAAPQSAAPFLGRAIRDPGDGREFVGLSSPIPASGESGSARLALLVIDRSLLDRTARVAAPAADSRLDILRPNGEPLFGGVPQSAGQGRSTAVANPALMIGYAPAASELTAWRTEWLCNGGALAGAMILLAMAVRVIRRRRRLKARRAARARARDTIALRRNLSELADAAARADQANRTKSQLLANVTHELRTPLNAVLGFSEAIRRELFGPVGNPRYAHYAGLIHDAGAHLLSLIDDLLDMAKVEAGKMEIAPTRVSAAALARSAVDLVEITARERGVALTVGGIDDCPDLYVDLRAAKQVLINLLANAVKFTASGGRVDLRFADCGDDGVAITIADTGIGMSPEDIVVAFEAFGRAANPSQPQQPGTGLGLPLARALVRLHGGELTLTSEPGYGTTVTVIFPPEEGTAESSTEQPALAEPDYIEPAKAA